MTVIDGLLIFFTIVLVYFIIVLYLNKKGILKKYNITLWGPALMWRTSKGKKILKKISSKKRFWKAFGSSGVVLCFIVMIVMTALIVWQTWAILEFTPEQREMLPGPEFILVLPGINPIIPIDFLWYIIIGLIIAMVFHEFSHGILTLVSKLKVKSLGLLYLIVPIGAFCEPDEEELKKAKTKSRMRIYAAGPTANFVVVLVTLLIFSFGFMSAVQPVADGAKIYSIDNNSPAESIGLEQGYVITYFNNTRIKSASDYYEVLLNTSANTSIPITYYNGQDRIDKFVYLTDLYTEHEKRGYQNNASFKGVGYLGIFLLNDNVFNMYISALKNPFRGGSPNAFLLVYILPLWGYFQGYNPIIAPFTNSYIITGPLSVIPGPIFWFIVNALFWIFWINLAVAIFNVLPIIPLDGGFLFNDALGAFVRRVKKGVTKEQQESISQKITVGLSLFLLFLVLFPFFIKYLPF